MRAGRASRTKRTGLGRGTRLEQARLARCPQTMASPADGLPDAVDDLFEGEVPL